MVLFLNTGYYTFVHCKLNSALTCQAKQLSLSKLHVIPNQWDVLQSGILFPIVNGNTVAIDDFEEGIVF